MDHQLKKEKEVFYGGTNIGYILPDIKKPENNLKSIMDFRHNIRFFDQNKIPTKEQIDNILIDSHKYVPHKNNLPGMNIKIYGPEYKKDKEDLVLATVCGPGRVHYLSKNGKYYGDIDELRKRYVEWKKAYNDKDRKVIQFFRKEYGLNFNPQVDAPYLLTFTHRLRVPTPRQEKFGMARWVWDNAFTENAEYKWYLGVGIHSYAINLLAAEQGIYGSYCRCFQKLPNLYSKCLEDIKKSPSDVVFLGLGYRDYGSVYRVDKNKTDMEDYIKWM